MMQNTCTPVADARGRLAGIVVASIRTGTGRAYANQLPLAA